MRTLTPCPGCDRPMSPRCVRCWRCRRAEAKAGRRHESCSAGRDVDRPLREARLPDLEARAAQGLPLFG